jgi:hypothetical protein
VSRQLRHNSLVATSALALGVCLGLGCSGDKQPAGASPPADGPKTATADATADQAQADGEKKKVVEGAPPGGDDRYALSIETPEAKAGERAQVVVRVVPKAPWHMNLDFPTSLELEPPGGVEVTKASLKKADAAELDEDQCRFDVEFEAADAGEKAFTGTFKFAVCQDDACVPVTESVEFKVAVR